MDDSHGMGGQFNLRLSPSLLQAAKRKAVDSNVSLSAVVRQAFKQWMAGQWEPFVHPATDELDRTERKDTDGSRTDD